MPGVNRRLLTPRWVLVHLVFLAAFAATLWLGWWQWESAHEAGGSFRNLGYALQWPLFGGFVAFLWYQIARMAGAPEQGADEGDPAPEASPDESAPRDDARPRSRRSPVPPPAPPVDSDEDPELAAYNAYLADLNRADRRR